MKTKQKMLTKPITAGFASIFYFKSVKDGILYQLTHLKPITNIRTLVSRNSHLFFHPHITHQPAAISIL